MIKQELRERVDLLITVASIGATASRIKFRNMVPNFERIKPSRWEFIFAVAGVFIAMEGFPAGNYSKKYSSDELLEMDGYLLGKLSDVHQGGEFAMIDISNQFHKKVFEFCGMEYYQTAETTRFGPPDALGHWIYTSILGPAPSTMGEKNMAREFGQFVIEKNYYFWELN